MSHTEAPKKTASDASTSSSIKEYKLRIMKDSKKKFQVMRFNTNLNIDFTKWKNVKMVRENIQQDTKGDGMSKFGAGSKHSRDQKEELRKTRQKQEEQPWILEVGDNSGKKFRGIREGGVNKRASLYVFLNAHGGVIEAYPLHEWYDFQPVHCYKSSSPEETESKLDRRDKAIKYSTVMMPSGSKGDKSFQSDSKQSKLELSCKKRTDLKISDVGDVIMDFKDDEYKKKDLDCDTDRRKKPKKSRKSICKEIFGEESDSEIFNVLGHGDKGAQELEYIESSESVFTDIEITEIKPVTERSLRNLFSSDEDSDVEMDSSNKLDKKEENPKDESKNIRKQSSKEKTSKENEKESSSYRKKSSSDKKESSGGRKKSSSDKKESSGDIKKSSTERKESSHDRKKSSSDKRESSHHRKKSSSDKKESSGDRKKSSTERKESSHDRTKSSSDKKESSGDRKKSSSDKKESSSDRKKSSTERKESSHDRKKSSSERKESLSDRKKSSSDKRESSHHGKKSSSDKKESSGDRKKLSSERKESSHDRKKSSSERKESSSNRKKSSSDKKESSSDRKKSSSVKQESSSDKKESLDDRNKSSEKMESSHERKEPSSEKRESSHERKEPSSEKRESSHERKEQSSEKKDSISEKIESSGSEYSDSSWTSETDSLSGSPDYDNPTPGPSGIKRLHHSGQNSPAKKSKRESTLYSSPDSPPKAPPNSPPDASFNPLFDVLPDVLLYPIPDVRPHPPFPLPPASQPVTDFTENCVRKYLMTQRTTICDLLYKFKNITNMPNNELVDKMTIYLRNINPNREVIQGKLYLSLRPPGE